MQVPNTFRGGPDERGHFGIYGGRFVAETLMPLVLAVEAAYAAARNDPGFQAELDQMRGGQDVELELERLKGEIGAAPAKEIEGGPADGDAAQASPASPAEQPQAGENS